MNNLNQEDYKNILALINIAPIKGNEAETVAILKQKIFKLLEPVVEAKDDKSRQN